MPPEFLFLRYCKLWLLILHLVQNKRLNAKWDSGPNAIGTYINVSSGYKILVL